MKNESDDKILSWYMQFIISYIFFFAKAKEEPSIWCTWLLFFPTDFFFGLIWDKKLNLWKFNQTIKFFWDSYLKSSDTFSFVQIYKLFYTNELFMWEICCWRFNHLDFFFVWFIEVEIESIRIRMDGFQKKLCVKNVYQEKFSWHFK